MIPSFERPENSGTESLFSNPVLERLTRSHIAVPISLFVIYSCCLMTIHLVNSSLPLSLSILLFFLGWITFTWVEYQVHRHVFHLPLTSMARKKFQYTMHGVHHHHPKDKDRLAMPPALSILVATIVLFLLKIVLGVYVFAFFPGFLLGYAFYLLIHYLVHIHHPPKNVFKYLWTNHILHHYKDGKFDFGVSTPLWDYVYGTKHKSST